MSVSSHLDDLIERHFEQTLSESECVELQQALTTNPEAADRFAVRARLEADLTFCFVESKAREQVVRLGENELRVKRSSRREWLWAGAAALLGLSVCAFWLIEQRNGGAVANQQARLLNGSLSANGVQIQSIKPDTPLRAIVDTEIAFTDGSRLRLDKGATATLLRPAAGDRQQVEVMEGRCSFNVVKAPGAFRVKTKVGNIKVLGTEFSVELKPSTGEGINKGDSAMKLSTVMLVAVVAGLVEVNVGGVSYSLSGGQTRAFGEEKKEGVKEKDRPKREGEKGEGDKGAPRKKLSGEISAVSADSITLTARGDAGPRTETAKITAATKIQVQTAEDEIRKGEGGQEKRVPKTVTGTAADLKVGERAMMAVNEAGEAVMISQFRKVQREGGERKEGDKPAVRREGGDAPRKEGGEGDKKAPSRIGTEGNK